MAAVALGAAIVTASLLNGDVRPPASPAPQPSGHVGSSAPAPSRTGGSIAGDVPPPDAEPPSGITYVSGLPAETVWDTLTRGGYGCVSFVGMGMEDATLGWTIRCERSLPGAQVAVDVPYWSMRHVVGVFMTVLSDPLEGSIDDARLVVAEASLLAGLEYDGAAPVEATAWVEQSLADSGCFSLPCQASSGSAEVAVQLGERGSATISVVGIAIVP